MKKELILGLLFIVACGDVVQATPIIYTATGVAGYEELVEVTPGVYSVNYNEIDLWGSVTFDDEIAVHTSDKTYYSYNMMDFQIATSLDTWSGTSGMLHWESDDSYAAPYDQYPGYRNLYLPDFLGSFSSFDFNNADGSDYPYDNMSRWLHLPPQVEIWSDNLYNTSASYVSFTLTAPAESYPIPEPATAALFLLGSGMLGYVHRRQAKVS